LEEQSTTEMANGGRWMQDQVSDLCKVLTPATLCKSAADVRTILRRQTSFDAALLIGQATNNGIA
jgi:hypothetical protein